MIKFDSSQCIYELDVFDRISLYRRKRQTKRATYEYRYDLDNEWLTVKKFKELLKSKHIEPQDWYDKVCLGITDKTQRPHCKVCGAEIPFLGIGAGYQCHTTCSLTCANYLRWSDSEYKERLRESDRRGAAKRKLRPDYQEHMQRWNAASKTPEAKQKLKESLRDYNDNRGGRERSRQSAIKRWQRQEEHEKQCQAQQKRLLEKPETHFVPETWCSVKSDVPTTKCINAKSDGTIRVRSNLERDFVEIVLEHLDCTYAYESITVPWFDESGKQHAYFIDFVVQLHGKTYLIEVKPWRFRHDKDNVAKSNAAKLYANEHGMSYVMIHENECRDIETFITYIEEHINI